jgi:hypothetical protein
MKRSPLVKDDTMPTLIPTRTSLEWLWPGHAAFRCVTVLAGDPLSALDLIARVTASAAANVVLLNARDDVPVLRQHLDALGADLDRITLHHTALDGPAPSLQNLDDRGELAVCLRERRASLLALDPLRAYTRTLRAGLVALSGLAERYDIAALAVVPCATTRWQLLTDTVDPIGRTL